MLSAAPSIAGFCHPVVLQPLRSERPQMRHAAVAHELADRISRTFGSNQQVLFSGDLSQFVTADGLIAVESKAVLRLPLHAEHGDRKWPRFHLRQPDGKRPRGEPGI